MVAVLLPDDQNHVGARHAGDSLHRFADIRGNRACRYAERHAHRSVAGRSGIPESAGLRWSSHYRDLIAARPDAQRPSLTRHRRLIRVLLVNLTESDPGKSAVVRLSETLSLNDHAGGVADGHSQDISGQVSDLDRLLGRRRIPTSGDRVAGRLDVRQVAMVADVNTIDDPHDACCADIIVGFEVDAVEADTRRSDRPRSSPRRRPARCRCARPARCRDP